jgi:hypothetical protein
VRAEPTFAAETAGVLARRVTSNSTREQIPVQAQPNAHTMQAFMDAAICFFVPFLAASPTGATSAMDIYSLGKTINICLLGVVTMEIMIVARYWTWWFAFVCIFSYTLVYPFILVFPLFQQGIDAWDMAHYGIAVNIMHTHFFWIALVTVYAMTFSIRYLERSTKWLFRPDDNMIRAELEVLNSKDGISSTFDNSAFGDPEENMSPSDADEVRSPANAVSRCPEAP